MVECLRPQPMHTIADPACGTGGFFLAAYDWLTEHRELDKEQKEFLKYHTFAGNEIVAGTRRLAPMNLFLHNIDDINSQTLISPADSLIAASDIRYDYVVAFYRSYYTYPFVSAKKQMAQKRIKMLHF